MSASSRNDFEKQRRMLSSVTGLDQGTNSLDLSNQSAESSQKAAAVTPESISNDKIEKKRMIRTKLPEELGLTNLQSPFFRLSSDLLTYQSQFHNMKDLHALSQVCRRQLPFLARH